MISWVQHAAKALSELVDESIKEEDEGHQRSDDSFHLAPLQSHFGLLKEKPIPLFHVLPTELKLLIFSFLPPEDLITCICNVSKEWHKLAVDDRSWEWRLQREIFQWEIYGFHPLYHHLPRNSSVDELPFYTSNPVTINGITISWKDWYLQQYLHNSALYHSPQKALQKMVSTHDRNHRRLSVNAFRSSVRGRKKEDAVFQVPIFGQAMESAASGLLHKMMWSHESPLSMTGLYPGKEGIGAGVVFRVNKRLLNISAIYGDYPLDIHYWFNYFQQADAFIYAIDAMVSEDDVMIAAGEMKTALAANNQIPLIIFACEQENCINPNAKRMRPCQLAEELKAHNQGRKWCVQTVRNVADICKGLEWISSVM